MLVIHFVYIQTNERGNSPNEEAPYIYSFSGGNQSFVTITNKLSFLPSAGFTITGWLQQEQGNAG